jgi:glycosyltransferase involved in cell wall biosynthesis
VTAATPESPSKPLRVTLVVHQFPPRYFTGTEQYALAVGKALKRRGHDVDVFTLDPDFRDRPGLWRESREEVEGLPVRRISFWACLEPDWNKLDYRHPMMAETFARHLEERGTDVVHSFHLRLVGADLVDRVAEQGRALVVSLMDFWWICPRVILMKQDGSPCDGPPDGGRGCIPCHTPQLVEDSGDMRIGEGLAPLHAAAPDLDLRRRDLLGRQASIYSRPAFLRRRLRRADAIVAPTRFLGDVFVRNGAPADKIKHLSYGVDTTGLAEAVEARRGTAKRPLTFGFFGTLADHKAPHLIVDAMQSVRGDCRALLRGRASDFPAYSEPLLQRAAKDPRITTDGPFPHHDLADVLAAIDVLVVPSVWHENAPFVVLEARAAGLPVLASRYGGLAEIVADEVDGELFQPGDSADLARRMQRLLDEPDRLANYRAAVRPPKTLQQAVDEFEEVYRGVLGR